MNRRNFIGGLGLTALSASPLSAWALSTSPGLPASPTGIVVVELANFHCNRCRSVNDHFDRLKTAAVAAGLDLRFAPVAWEGQSLWPDRVYYAVRDLYPEAEDLMRSAMFDGIQREGMRFEDMPQVLSYLERRQVPRLAGELGSKFNLAAVAERAMSDDVLFPEMKAGRLLDMSGADEVPVFSWIQDGNLVKTLSPRDAAEPVALVQLVHRTLTQKQ